MHGSATCPPNIRWSDESLERDLYIQTNVVTVLAMDGRRRWLDIQKLVFYSVIDFPMSTNFMECYALLDIIQKLYVGERKVSNYQNSFSCFLCFQLQFWALSILVIIQMHVNLLKGLCFCKSLIAFQN